MVLLFTRKPGPSITRAQESRQNLPRFAPPRRTIIMTRGNYRHTKIVATLGPATESPEQLEKLILAGVDVIRLNMAPATEAWVLERVECIREVSARIGRHVAVMMDVKGPEIRTGPISQPIDLV